MDTGTDLPRRWRIPRGFGRAPRFVWAYTEWAARCQVQRMLGLPR